MALSLELKNRLGFIILGLSNLSAYSIMLAAAYDLLASLETIETPTTTALPNATIPLGLERKNFCNKRSTGTILVANSLPGLCVKLLYPFLLIDLRPAYKVIALTILSALAFTLAGLFKTETFIFAGVVCGSLGQGLGEPLFVSFVRIYGDSSFIGWSMGTGLAGLFGATFYALLKTFFSIKTIMLMLLSMPISLLIAYFFIIEPIPTKIATKLEHDLDVLDQNKIAIADLDDFKNSRYEEPSPFNFMAKIYHMPMLAKYFAPLMLVYFSEYFINMGLFELVYYPELNYLDHAAQYRWFQVAYQLGVFISRSSLDFFVIKKIWTMSILQALNAILILLHVFRLIHIPGFYVCYSLIIYEGLLGGFTYINAFLRIKNEISPEKVDFSISTTVIADSLGIVAAGLAAVPAHDLLCDLYDWTIINGGSIASANFDDLINVYQRVRA